MQGGKTGRWVRVVAALLLLGASVMGERVPSAPRLVAYGDSYVAPGEHGEPVALHSWLKLVDRPVLSLGHAGDGVADTLRVLETSGNRATHDVVLEVGINDVRRQGDTEMSSFVDDFSAVLDHLSSARRVVVVLPLPILDWGPKGSPEALLLYRATERELAGLHPEARVVDPLPQWHAESMLMADGIHPDTSGRKVIAAAVRQALRAG